MATPTNAVVPDSLASSTNFDPAIVRDVSRKVTEFNLWDHPVISSIPKMNVRGKTGDKTEWLQDDLNDRSLQPVEFGSDAVYHARKNPRYRENFMQTLFDAFKLTEESTRAGYYHTNSRQARELRKHEDECLISIEKSILLDNQGAQQPTDSNGNLGKAAMLQSIFETNVLIGNAANSVTPTKGGWDATTKKFVSRTKAHANGRVKLSFAQIRKMGNDVWEDQSEVSRSRTMLGSRAAKDIFDASKDQSIGTYEHQIGTSMPATIQTQISMWRGLGGNFNFMPVKHMKGSDAVYFLDLSKIMLCYWAWNRTKRLAESGLTRNFGRYFMFTLKLPSEPGAALLLDRKYE